MSLAQNLGSRFSLPNPVHVQGYVSQLYYSLSTTRKINGPARRGKNAAEKRIIKVLGRKKKTKGEETGEHF